MIVKSVWVLPVAGVTVNQLPPDLLTLYETGAEAVRSTAWICGLVLPAVAVGENEEGVAMMLGGGSP